MSLCHYVVVVPHACIHWSSFLLHIICQKHGVAIAVVQQYRAGVGGILGDEMGLGKTLQTLSFLAALKDAGLPGPHLVVTPLAVVQNWANELRRFTPQVYAFAVFRGYDCIALRFSY